MTDSLSLTFTLTMDDIVAWSQHHYAHSALCKRAFWIWRIVLCAIMFPAIVAITARDAAGITIALLGTGIYYFIFPRFYWRALAKHVKKAYAEGKNKGMSGEHRLTIGDDGIASSSEVGEGKIGWAGIERIVEIPGYTFVYFGALAAAVIPEQRIVEGEYHAFMAELKRRWEAAQKEQAT